MDPLFSLSLKYKHFKGTHKNLIKCTLICVYFFPSTNTLNLYICSVYSIKGEFNTETTP
jgi:hypothetical protein